MAKKIIANAPLAVKYTMEAIERGVEMPQEEGLISGGDIIWPCLRHGRHAGRHQSFHREKEKQTSKANSELAMAEKLQPLRSTAN